MKKYFSKGFLATFIVAGIFMFGVFINTTTVSAQTTSSMNICQLVNLLGTLGVIPADKVSIALTAMGCSTTPPTTSPVATIIGTPTLKLTYDQNNKESMLTANFNVSIDAISNDIVLPVVNTFGGNFINGDNIGYNVRSAVISTNPGQGVVKTVTNDGVAHYVISAGDVGKFNVTLTAKPGELFAGSYFARLYGAYLPEFQAGLQISPADNASNKVVIIGETSPYISSVTVIPTTNSSVVKVDINGVRLTGIMSKNFDLYVDGVLPDTTNVTQLNNSDSLVSLTFKSLSSGDRHSLKLINYVTGESNTVWFNFSGNTTTYPGFIMNTDKSTYSLTDTVSLTLSRADGSSVSYPVDLYLQGSDNVKVLVNKSLTIGQNTVKTINLSNYIKSVGSYFAVVCDAGQDCVGGINTNSVSFIVTSSAITPSITITSPNKRTTVGNTFKASGACTNYQGNVSVYYYSTQKVSVDALCSNGKWSTDINLYTNALSGTFTLYASLSSGQQATLEVPFKIKQTKLLNPSITVTSPNGGIYNIGDTMTIAWTSTDLPTNATVSIGINGDSVTSTMTGAQIVTNIPASNGNYSWIIPSFLGENLSGKKYDVYVSSLNFVSGLSNGYFTINAPTVVVPACTYTYGDWGTCTNGTQTRTYSTVSSQCNTPVTPVISQPCTVTPPVVDNDIYCGSKTQYPTAGGCGSKKAQIIEAGVYLSISDVIEVIKIDNYYRSGAKTGAHIVACPANTNYRVCVENGNDGVANYILLGVKSAQLNYNYSPNMSASALVGFDSVLKLIQVLK